MKDTRLSEFGVLHFAAHAVVDEKQPQRSAVVLAPGAEQEDGLLQPREIVELDLSGQIVILSACSSAGGTVLEGEGAMSLARAFFQAGAHAVIGSLWPLRDDEAADLVDDLSGSRWRASNRRLRLRPRRCSDAVLPRRGLRFEPAPDHRPGAVLDLSSEAPAEAHTAQQAGRIVTLRRDGLVAQ